jgi:hypothetical protein
VIVSKVKKQPKADKVTASKVSPVVAATEPHVCCSITQISERAFQIYESRGSEDGHDVQDWLHAERQILATR